MGFAQGAQAGQSLNPFDVVLERVDKAMARKREDEKDLNELQKLFGLQKQKFEQDQTMQREKQFFDQYQPAGGGETGIDFQGTPFESIAGGKSYSPRNTQQPIVMVDPITGEQRTVGSTPKGSKVIQQKPTLAQEATEAEMKSLAKIKPNLDRANESIQQLRKLFEAGDTSKSVKKGDVFGGLMERAKGVKEGFVAKAGGNASLQQYLKLRKSFASLITKGGFLEAGVLTNPDIERALGSLPTTGSTKEEIDLGWKVLNEVMTTAQKKFEDLKSGKSSQSSGDEFSNMSDEELRALAGGQ